MKYCGDYYEGETYNKGDVVVGGDHVSYLLLKPCPAGTDPKNTLYWGRCSGIVNQIVLMFHDALQTLAANIATTAAAIPQNITEDSVILKTQTASYNGHVDDTGLAPEVVAEEIVEEAEGGET